MVDLPLAVNESTGEQMVFASGQWIPLDGGSANQTARQRPIPLPPTAGIQNQGRVVDTRGQQINNQGAAAEVPYKGPAARSGAIEAGGKAMDAIRKNATGGLSPEQMAQAMGRRATAQALLRQLNQVEDYYAQNFRGGGITQSLREYLPNAISPTNQEFDKLATTMFPNILKFSKGTDPNPTEWLQRKFQEYIPKSGQFDNTNARVMGETRRLAEGVLKETQGVAGATDPDFQEAVSMLVSNPSSTARAQYDRAAKARGWAASSVVLSGLNLDAAGKGRLYTQGK